MFSMRWSAILSSLLSAKCLAASSVDYSQYVNPFIGGSGPFKGLAFGGGDIFVGGTLPFGVAKVGIDTFETNASYSTLNGGWTPDGYVTAISMMHESGTGGFPKYGVIPQMPLTSIDAPVNLLDNRTYWQPRVGDDTARVGYFQTRLQNGVTIELSAARHSGIMQYSFPAATDKYVLVDLSHYLPSETGGYASQVFLDGELTLNGSVYSGYGTYGGGWNEGAPYTVYFYGEFDVVPDQSRTFQGPNTDLMQKKDDFDHDRTAQATYSESKVSSGPHQDRIGALFGWNATRPSQVRSRVGISFISVEKARQYKDDEISSWDLNITVQAAVKEWNEDVLSKIQVPTGDMANATNLALLYSSLYFMHLMPSDRTGENPLWVSNEPSWDDFYTLWDIFRCTVSLYHLLQPERYEGMIRSLIDIWRFEGFMPDGRSGNWNGLVQGGSNADNVLADAYVKGLRGDINWTAGYQAMLKDAEVVPNNTFSVKDPSASVKEGRGALDDWINLGYVSLDRNTRSISRTVEYALNDYALSVVAQGEAPGDESKYLIRSANWQHLWNENVTSHGFRGFLTPRLTDGTWNVTGYNPALCGDCEWKSISYEATPWEYSFTVPHDMTSLIRLMGGATEFERRLDYIFQPNTSEQDLSANGAGITSIMNIGYYLSELRERKPKLHWSDTYNSNEPDFATPYLYNYLNKQHKSVNQSRSLANQYFHNQLYGLPGNSDAGALNSWLVWQMLGLYPVVTQPVYLVGSPWFTDINMTINGNVTLRLTSNGDPQSLGQSGYYVQSVAINGKPLKKNWFIHQDVMVNGGHIEFTVGHEPIRWEEGDVPPSPGHLSI